MEENKRDWVYINPYMTIASYHSNEKYKLSALLNPDGSYCMCLFDFTNSSGKKVYYDNLDYIFGDEFYGIIKTWVVDKKVVDGEKFSEIIEDIPLKDFPIILEMLEEGLKLGFDKDEV